MEFERVMVLMDDGEARGFLFGYDTLQRLGLLITFMFAIALLLLLLHPMSRDYQRIWFK